MPTSTRYLIINTNQNRDAYYKLGDVFKSSPPFWLTGDYVVGSCGDSHNDIFRAHLYIKAELAQRQADKLNAKFAVGGAQFRPGIGYRYPDSLSVKEYRKVVPTYEVKAVKMTMEIM